MQNLVSMQFDIKRLLAAEGKAIPYHPMLSGDEPVSTYQAGYNQGGRENAKISQREAPRHLDAYGGKQAVDWLMDCIRLYGDTASTAEWYLEEDDGTRLVRKKKKDDGKDVKEAPKDLVDLLTNPNPFMDYMELVDLAVADLLLVGNSYWFKWQKNAQGKPLAIYRLAPGYVKIVPGPYGPIRYEYQPPGAKDKLDINPADIVHMRLPNVHSAYYGLGIVQGGGRAFDLELALTDTQASYFENHADPSMIVQSERRVPRDVFNKLRMQLRSRVAGHRKAGELLVLEAGLKATTLKHSAREALFDTLTKLSRDRILAMFRASPKLFGITDGGTTGDKTSDARREFDTKTMRPFLDKLQSRVTEGLIKEGWGLTFKIDYNYIMPLEDLVKLSAEFAATPGVKIKEVRRFLKPAGLSESTGDTTIDEMVINLPGQNLGPSGQGPGGGPGFPDKPLPGEPGRPPLPGNTKPFPKAGGALPAGAAAARPAGKALTVDDMVSRLDLIADQARLEGKSSQTSNRFDGEKRPDDSLAQQRQSEIDAVARSLEVELGKAAGALERGLLDHTDGKAFRPNDVVGRIRRSKSWGTFSAMLTKAAETAARRAVSTAVNQETARGVTPQGELDYEALAKAALYRKGGIQSVMRTLRDKISKAVKPVRDGGGDRAAVNAAIQQTIADWTTDQAPRVAATEAVAAYNEGTLATAEAAGVSQVFVTDGNDTDEPCVAADGSVWSIEHARDNRLEHPNCRRAFIPLTDAQPAAA